MVDGSLALALDDAFLALVVDYLGISLDLGMVFTLCYHLFQVKYCYARS
jgi:hypothetical protein